MGLEMVVFAPVIAALTSFTACGKRGSMRVVQGAVATEALGAWCRRVAACGSYLWGGLARVDVLDAPLSTSLAFYGPHALRVHAVPLLPGTHGSAPAQSGSGADGGAVEPAGEELLGQETVQQRGGLRIAKEVLAQPQ